MIKKIIISLSVIILFSVYFVMAVPYYSGDVKNHLVWANSLLNEGPMGFYDREFHDFAFPNYPPVAMGLFALSLKLFELINQLVWYINTTIPAFPSNLVAFFKEDNVRITFLKLPAILSNFGIAYLIFLFIKHFKEKITFTKSLLVPAIFLLNPASFYLSVIWGQIDMLPVLFLLISIYSVLKLNAYWSIFFLIMALLSKQTVIIFTPLILFLIFKTFGFKNLIKSLFFGIAVFYLAYLPFHQFSLIWPIQLYYRNFTLVSYSVAENAINLWGFLFNFQRASDLDKFLFLTYQQWGYLMLAIFLVWPISFFVKTKITLKKIIEIFLLVSIIYFFAMTRMHERYLAPAIVLVSLMVGLDKRFIPQLIFLSLLNFLNLYKGLSQPDLRVINFLVDSVTILKILVVCYFGILIYSLKLYIKKND